MSETLREFTKDVEEHIDAINDIVESRMRNTGDVCADSQKVCVLNALSELQSNINGVYPEDLNE